jgi:hypothetical protein
MSDTNTDHFHPVTEDPRVDANGHAALLLVESLIHCLRERAILSLDDTIDLVDSAISVQTDIIDHAEGPAPVMRRSLTLLEKIAHSLLVEQKGPTAPADGG